MCQKRLRLNSPSTCGVGWSRTPKSPGSPGNRSSKRTLPTPRFYPRPPQLPTSTAEFLRRGGWAASRKRSIAAIPKKRMSIRFASPC